MRQRMYESKGEAPNSGQGHECNVRRDLYVVDLTLLVKAC